MTARYHLGVKMTKVQWILGWLYLPVYLILADVLLSVLANLLKPDMTALERNLLYFAMNTVFVLLVYHRFLWKSLRGFTHHFWTFIQTLILGFALYYITALVFSRVMSLLAGDVPSFNDQLVESFIAEDAVAMLICSVVLAPVVEEVLVRGVVFGSIHRKSRILAYAISILLFSAMHVWQFYPYADPGILCLSALRYFPAGVALGWTYEKSGTIWTPIVLHAFINILAYSSTVLF